MSQPYGRVYNFSAGPSTLPVEVLEQARDELLNYRGAGMSVMEMSHRAEPFETIIAEAERDLRQLLGVPADYKVLFLQGGATLQFSMVPLSFLPQGRTAAYVVTGTWGSKAREAAEMVGAVNCLYDAKATKYDRAPALQDLQIPADVAYLHFTSNETVQGVDFQTDPELPVPNVCDMSSNILSRPVDVGRYDLIYAGAQKNMGPAGACVVILSPRMLELAPEQTHPMLDYRLQVEHGSMYNTPPCYSIYMCGLVYRHLLKHGGLEAMAARNCEKARLLYDAIDGSGGFYTGHAQPGSRSFMNVTFRLPSEELTSQFVKEAAAEGFDGLKGHRSVGGCRASIYNAFPVEGCGELAGFMKQFAGKNG